LAILLDFLLALSACFLASFYNCSALGIGHGPPFFIGVTFGIGLLLPALAFGSLATRRLGTRAG
jgi:4-hydroxybenzoate polyprenyltransferase